MGSPLGCLLGFVFIIFTFLFVLLTSIAKRVRDIFSTFSPKGGKAQSRSNSSGDQQHRNQQQTSGTPHSSRKIFEDNEGEYVDFEEIK